MPETPYIHPDPPQYRCPGSSSCPRRSWHYLSLKPFDQLSAPRHRRFTPSRRCRTALPCLPCSRREYRRLASVRRKQHLCCGPVSIERPVARFTSPNPQPSQREEPFRRRLGGFVALSSPEHTLHRVLRLRTVPRSWCREAPAISKTSRVSSIDRVSRSLGALRGRARAPNAPDKAPLERLHLQTTPLSRARPGS